MREGAELDVKIRRGRPDDAEDLVAVDLSVLRDGRGMLREVDGVVTVEEKRRTLENYQRKPDRGALYVAEVDGRVVAEASVLRRFMKRAEHGATLAVQVHTDHQGRGIGRRLMDEAIAWAVDGDGAQVVERLELHVRGDNDRAIAMYRSLGFDEEGRRRRAVKLPDGTYTDDVTMGRLLDRGSS